MSGGNDGKIEETAAEKEQSRTAIKFWNIYQRTGVPAREEYKQKVDQINTEENRQFARGVVAQNTSANYGQARENLKTNLSASGANPNDGGYQKSISDITERQGANSGVAQGNADNSQTADYVTGLSNQIAVSEGDATTAATGLADLANISASEARQSAENDFNESQARQNLVGQGAGLAAANFSAPQSKGTGFAGIQGDTSSRNNFTDTNYQVVS